MTLGWFEYRRVRWFVSRPATGGWLAECPSLQSAQWDKSARELQRSLEHVTDCLRQVCPI